jgi:hypothetical protein
VVLCLSHMSEFASLISNNDKTIAECANVELSLIELRRRNSTAYDLLANIAACFDLARPLLKQLPEDKCS